MVSDESFASVYTQNHEVLILVLMEYGLWHICVGWMCCKHIVLILVLMEYGLWRKEEQSMSLSIDWS